MKKDISLVYMVAGVSSRFGGNIKPLTEVGPNKETLIEYSLNQALKNSFYNIIFIVGNKTEIPFKEKFGRKYRNLPVYYSLQKYDESKRDKPWGTLEALCTIKTIVSPSFIVCNGDDLYGEECFEILFEHLQKDNRAINATVGFDLEKVLPDGQKVNRAIFELDEKNYVKDIYEVINLEKNSLSSLGLSLNTNCSMNIFALYKEVIPLLEKEFFLLKEKYNNDRKIEFLLPNTLGKLCREEKILLKLYSTNSSWLGITYPGDEKILREKLKDSSLLETSKK
ncbi:MAG: sugar phosphate nucleotidyltransferase [Candidatus Pacearchaeota archaeon]